MSPTRTTTADDGGKALGTEEGLASGLGSEGATEGWQPLSVTDVEGGETLLLREISRGTHVGRAIDAVVIET